MKTKNPSIAADVYFASIYFPCDLADCDGAFFATPGEALEHFQDQSSCEDGDIVYVYKIACESTQKFTVKMNTTFVKE